MVEKSSKKNKWVRLHSISQICHNPIYYILFTTDPTFMRVESHIKKEKEVLYEP
jgi:hypothetical protein